MHKLLWGDRVKQKPLKTYDFWILLSEAIGALSGWITREGTRIYSETITKPPLSPPAIVFPIAWGILYALMGIGAARVRLAPNSKEQQTGINLFIAQLIVNFFWSPLFFNAQAFGFAFLWLILLWVLVFWMILTFRKTDRRSAILQIPYLIWLTFAAYLNLGVWLMNR